MQQPRQNGPPLPIKASTCPACGKTMRLTRCEPSPRYTNMVQMTFHCECGVTTHSLVADKD
jgi:C4-type Zn-finger protein